MTCEGPIGFLFPANTTGTLETPGQVTVQSIPTLLTFSLWLLFEILGTRRSPTRLLLLITDLLAFLQIVTLGLLTWRVFDIFACDNISAAESWRMLFVILVPVSAGVCSVTSNRFTRISISLAILLASACVVADYFIRLELSKNAAQPIVASQQSFCFIATACLLRLKPRRRRTTVVNGSRVYEETVTGEKVVKSKPQALVAEFDPLAGKGKKKSEPVTTTRFYSDFD